MDDQWNGNPLWEKISDRNSHYRMLISCYTDRKRYWREKDEKRFFENEKDGFYGTYYENPKGSDCAVIGLFGDDPNDYMAKCGAKWLHKNGVNVLCISSGKKNRKIIIKKSEKCQVAGRENLKFSGKFQCLAFFIHEIKYWLKRCEL